MVEPRYCIDTSSLIFVEQHYPRDVFESLWSWIEQQIGDGRLFAPDEVLAELEGKGTNALSRWAKSHKERLFKCPDGPLQATVADILAKFPNLTKKGKPFAKHEGDAWVIGLAHRETAACISEDKNRNAGVSFPEVCQAYGVPYLNFVEFLKREQAKF